MNRSGVEPCDYQGFREVTCAEIEPVTSGSQDPLRSCGSFRL